MDATLGFQFTIFYSVLGLGAGALNPGAALGVGTCPETEGKGASVTLLSFKTGSGGAGGGRYCLGTSFKSVPGSTGLI